MSPQFNVKVHGIGIRDLVFAHQSLSLARKIRPIVVIERKLRSTSEFINDRVPNSVQVLGTFFARKVDEVATKVSPLVLVVDPSGGVEWLVHIANVVDQEPYSV